MQQSSTIGRVTEIDCPRYGKELCLLVLDGGGVRGLSSLQIVKHIMESINPDFPPRPCDHFDMIGGTSTGGLIALMLGRLGMTVDEAIDAYLELSPKIFAKLHHRVTLKGKVQGRFDHTAVEQGVKELLVKRGLDPDALLKDPSESCKTFVCATSKQTSDTVVLSSYFSRRRGSEIHNVAKIWEAARATSAASSFFEPIRIGNEDFVDGATPANNPIQELWTEASDTFKEGDNWRLEDNVLCLVSVGTGIPTLRPFGDDPIQVGKSLLAIATDTERRAEEFHRHHPQMAKQYRYFRFNVLRGLEDVGLEDASKTDQILASTRKYLQTETVFNAVEACAEKLNERESFEAIFKTELGYRGLRTPYRYSSTKDDIFHGSMESLLSVTLSEDDKKDLFTEALLGSLYFEVISDRLDEIPEAHRRTFEWIFQDPKEIKGSWSSFKDWLTDGSGIYWIKGKAGSGKSTLMKFVVEDKRTDTLLLDGSRPVTKANFFFWNAGGDLQKSKTGLLRSLLHQCLTQQPSIAASIFSERWRHFRSLVEKSDSSWIGEHSLPSLIRAFKRLGIQSGFRAKFCFFIDGLDECDGSHEDMVKLFKSVASSPNIRVCLSSRPLNVFDEAFEECPTLILQELTGKDIELYVQTTLIESQNWRMLSRREPKGSGELVNEIVTKASGVFLWVTLVVGSLMEGLRNFDSISTLKKRLSKLPSDLSQLYGHMLDNLDPLYFRRASQIFQIALKAQEPPRTLTLAYAIEEDANLALRSMVLPTVPEDKKYLKRAIEAQLKSQCVGILEVKDDQVEFLHKTARDFLQTPSVWRSLTKGVNKNFDANLCLLRSFLIQLKGLPQPTKDESQFHKFWQLISNCLEYAALSESSTPIPQTALLDELDRVASYLWPIIISSAAFERQHRYRYTWPYITSKDHWADSNPRDYQRSYPWKDNFLALAIKYGLDLYVQQKLYLNPMVCIKKQGRPLIAYTMDGLRKWGPVPQRSSINLIKLLLQQGDNPNKISGGLSPWQEVLHLMCKQVRDAKRISDAERSQEAVKELLEFWSGICIAFLESGAELRATVKWYFGPSGTDPSHRRGDLGMWELWNFPALEVLKQVFKGYISPHLLASKLQKDVIGYKGTFPNIF